MQIPPKYSRFGVDEFIRPTGQNITQVYKVLCGKVIEPRVPPMR